VLEVLELEHVEALPNPMSADNVAVGTKAAVR